jgi:hypothetical protein
MTPLGYIVVLTGVWVEVVEGGVWGVCGRGQAGV